LLLRPLLLLGTLGALAYLIENGLGQWSALQLETTLRASPHPQRARAWSALRLAGRRPAARAALLAQRYERRIGDRLIVAVAGAASAAGAGLLAVAPNPLVALLGVTVGGLGLAAAAPTLISLAGRRAAADQRGAAVSTVSTVAYLGYLLGPPLIGLTASAVGLRLALTGVAAAGVLLLLGAQLLPAATTPPDG
jgi:MFS family permease